MDSPDPAVGSPPTFFPPNLDGFLSLVEIIDYNATHSPNHPIFRYQDEYNCVQTILWGQAVRAFHMAARTVQLQISMRSNVGPASVVGILAATDSVTFYCMIVGVMRAGFVPFLISTRNSATAIAHLLKATNCKALFVSEDQFIQNLATTACELRLGRESSKEIENMPILTVPSFNDLFTTSTESIQLLTLPAKVDPNDSCIILHSSGSTAFPNPITLTHRIVFEHGLLPTYGEIDLCGQVFSGHAVPMYHLMGFILIPWTTMLGLTVAVLPPSKTPILPSPDFVLSSAIATECTLLYCVPSFLESWVNKPSGLQALKKFSAVLFAGGPLQPSVGDMLTREGVTIAPMFGLTEVGAISLIIPKQSPKEGWDWFRTSPHVDLAFIRLEGREDVFRLVVKESAMNTPAVTNTVVDGVKAFDTKDLVIRHPKNPDLWKVFGRYDDQIMHSTGEKTNPAPIEAILLKDPKIASAVMFGRSKFQAGVLIMPAADYIFDPSDDKLLSEYRNTIWDTVIQANQFAPQHSKIFKEMILVGHPTKPFDYTAKGTPRRQAVLDSYEAEIENIYKAVEESSRSDIPAPHVWELPDITKFIRAVVRSALDQSLEDHEEIFKMGGDSLLATSIRNSILRALRQSKSISLVNIRAIPPDFVYKFPSISTLSAFVYGITSVKVHVNGNVNKDEEDGEEDFQWPALPQTGPTVLKLRKGKGEPPLIVMHGAGGSAVSFSPLQEKFRSAIWAIQVTRETPLTSVDDLSIFYFHKIKEQQPHGPYRLASYCASSVLLLPLAKLFEENGDEVAQLVMLDHFPTLFFHGMDPSSLDPEDPAQLHAYLRKGMEGICEAMRRGDEEAAAVRRRRLANEVWDAFNGLPTSPASQMFTRTAEKMTGLAVRFLLDKKFSICETGKKIWRSDLLLEWMSSIKAPLNVYVASEGLIELVAPEHREEWADLGTRRFFPNARLTPVKGSHYDFLADDVLIQSLQGGYVQ